MKLSTLNMRECYISYPNISFGGILIALIVPSAVVFAITRLPGHLTYNQLSREYIVAVIIPLVIDRGLGSGINEEMVFRGVLLKITEQSFGKKTAIFIISFVFGALHLLNDYPTFSEKILMLVCSFSMGILLSMVTLRSGNIWNAVLLHASANISEVIITLGNSPEFISPFVYTFAEDISSWFATGMDFIAAAYAIVIWGVIIFLAKTTHTAWCDEV